jgi:hypothetical protein
VIPKISGNKKTTKFWHLSLEVATFNVHGFNFWFLITSNVCKDFLKTLVMIRMILKCQKNSLFSYYLETNWRFYSKKQIMKIKVFFVQSLQIVTTKTLAEFVALEGKYIYFVLKNKTWKDIFSFERIVFQSVLRYVSSFPQATTEIFY